MPICLYTMLCLLCMVIQTSGVFDYSKGRKVILNSRLLEWSEAALECEQMNGTLLTIADTATMNDIAIEGRWIVWVGLKNNSTSATWHSGLPVEWSNWEPFTNQPAINSEHCISLETSSPFWWTAQNCSTKLPSLCETHTGDECEFTALRSGSIIGFSRTFYTDIDLANCENACITVLEFNCQSFEYNPTRRLCQLSDTNRWMHQGQFTTNDPEWDYYHMDCYTVDLNQTLVPNGWSPSTAPTTEAVTFCLTAEELVPTENETKEIETAIQELQDLGTQFKDKRRTKTKESTSDYRPSATYLGTIAMVIVSCLFGSIVVLDLLTATRHCCKDKKKKKKKKPQTDAMAQAQRRLVLSSEMSSGESININSNTDTSGQSSPIEMEDVRIQIRRPVLLATAITSNHLCTSDTATLQINRIASNNDNTIHEPVCLNTEIEIRDTFNTTLNTRERDDYSCITAAYVNTSPVLSPFHRSYSEKAKGNGLRRGHNHSFSEQRRVHSNDCTPSYSKFGAADFTLWPYHSVDRYYKRNSSHDHGKYILAYGRNNNAFQKDEEVESFKC